MTRAEGANLRARLAGTTTRTMFLTEGRRRLTAGSSDLMGLAFQPARTRSGRRRSLARATVSNGNGEKISMSTSSSDDDGTDGSGTTNSAADGCGSAAANGSAATVGRRGSCWSMYASLLVDLDFCLRISIITCFCLTPAVPLSHPD